MEAVNKVKDLLYNLVLEYQDSMEDVATIDVSGTIKRGTLSKNRKNCLGLINIEAKIQP